MNSKLKIKKILGVLMLFMLMYVLSPISNAAYESKAGGTIASTRIDGFFVNIRNMEKSGGTLGLNANLEKTTYKDTTENGVDVHMSLATEWGTVALLAVSDYGKYPYTEVAPTAETLANSTVAAATTGNITGVFGMANGNNEYVAGGLTEGSNQYTSILYAADSRYRNEYSTTVSEYHKGDALYQCAGWYRGSSGYISGTNQFYNRGRNGLFVFGTYFGNGDGICTRAVIVCGERTIELRKYY